MKKRSLTVTSKAKKKSLPIKDQKINKIYKKFKEIISRKISKKSFSIGVSGGPDSLCLAYMSKLYQKEFGNAVSFLIVDHKIRKESAYEALQVKKMLQKKNIKSKILKWKGATPKSNIQQKARKIRYSLISDYCQKKNIEYLVTAHHQDDQIENFFIRLLRGSGLTGLSSMSDTYNFSNNLQIIRPFLNFSKDELIYITKKFFKKYINDPSNEDEKFLRVRVRKYRRELDPEGLDAKKIIKTINNLSVAKNALEFYKNKALRKHFNFISKNKCIINFSLFQEEANEVIFKSISDIISLIAVKYYPPRSFKIINLINRAKGGKFKKCTLGGCVFEKRDGYFLISKEIKSHKLIVQMRK